MAFEWPDHLQETTRQRIASILWGLQRQPGGEVTEESGLATAALNEACRKAKVRQIPKNAPGVYANLLATLAGDRDGSPWETNALIEREVNGKRTYAIRLLLEDEDMPDPALAWTPANMPAEIAEAWYPDGEAEAEADEAVTIEDVPEVVAEEIMIDIPVTEVELDDPGMVAGGLPTTMLGRVLTISNLATELMINLASREAEPSKSEGQLRDQLAWALDENDRVRRELTEAQDAHRKVTELMQAKDAEIKSLRQALRVTGANLETLRERISANGHGPEDEADRQRKVLENLMRERPTTTP